MAIHLEHRLKLAKNTLTVMFCSFQINLMFIKFALERPNDCDSNFIDVFPERTDLPSRLHNFCGSIAEMVASRGSVLHVRFVADPKALNSSFEIVYTAFRERAKDEGTTQDTPSNLNSQQNNTPTILLTLLLVIQSLSPFQDSLLSKKHKSLQQG